MLLSALTQPITTAVDSSLCSSLFHTYAVLPVMGHCYAWAMHQRVWIFTVLDWHAANGFVPVLYRLKDHTSMSTGDTSQHGASSSNFQSQQDPHAQGTAANSREHVQAVLIQADDGYRPQVLGSARLHSYIWSISHFTPR